MSLIKRLSQLMTGAVYRNPGTIQKELLESIIRQNSNTAYGKRHAFAEIAASKNDLIKEFQNNVPIISYDNIADQIQLIKEGEPNILTSDKTIFFATSSGTTNSPKFIPVTEKRCSDFAYESILWSLKAAKHKPKAFMGKILSFTGARSEGFTAGGIPYGSISGFMADRMQKKLKNKMVVSQAMLDCKDFEEKMELYFKEALHQDVRTILFAYPIELGLFTSYVARKRGKNTISLTEIWPNISLLGCFKKGLEEQSLEGIIDDKIIVMDHGIRASEGTISIGYDPENRSGIPAVQQTFLEFREAGKTNETILVHQLEEGKSYEVIMTTPYGLYRYCIGDIIKVTGKRNNLPLFEFESRNNTLDVAGEHCPYAQIEQAISKVKSYAGFKFIDYAILPAHPKIGKPFYEIIMENSYPDDRLRAFLDAFDNALQANVLSYNRMRTYFGRLDSPRMTLVKKGTFDSINKTRIMTESQPKYKRIMKDGSFKELLLKEGNILRTIY